MIIKMFPRLNDPKTLSQVAGICLAIGIIPKWFFNPSSSVGTDSLHGICGMFLGMSLAMNIGALRMAARQGR
jgi:hypothetical protein